MTVVAPPESVAHRVIALSGLVAELASATTPRRSTGAA